MSNDYLSSLPEEMLEEISKFFQHDDASYPGDVVDEPRKSYRALAQTCKSLRPYFQRRLFSIVDLTAEIRVRTFAELIQVNPILASYIQTIDLQVDNMCMGLFQYPPLLAIMHAAASSSGTLPKIHLCIGDLRSYYGNELSNDIPRNTLTHILNAPKEILDAITHLRVTYSMGEAIPVGLFRLLSNLRVVSGYFVVSSISDKSSNNCSADHTPEFFRPKLDELTLSSNNPATIAMLCEQILDLSALKVLSLFYSLVGSTWKVYLDNAKYFLAQRLLDHAQSVQKIHLDIGVTVGPFYDLSRLQHLRECTLDIDVEAGKNPVPHLTQLLRTLPPFPQHDLNYLQIKLNFINIPPDQKDIAVSQVLFSLGTWNEFDAALVDVGASGTRLFELTLYFYTDIPTIGLVTTPLGLKEMLIGWERKYLPRSSQQQNLKIIILHPQSFPFR
ncbi:hypothetical protein BDN70DRAFT_939698 [Pholiota conissans]|uniref:F-box domain-containing protein n=1 Tax=Pholiota conissans TaxID=109636 RepID=A0A9P6CQR5_9AGAR|nr:hypothetical protein BDN70DRAFT_939698 [Pholiota conissans]